MFGIPCHEQSSDVVCHIKVSTLLVLGILHHVLVLPITEYGDGNVEDGARGVEAYSVRKEKRNGESH